MRTMMNMLIAFSLLCTTIAHAQDNWTQKSPLTKPPALMSHAMASIGGDKVILFGGGDGNTALLSNETWVYDLSTDTWTLQNPSTKPSPRFGHAMAYLGGDKVLLFGGADLDQNSILQTIYGDTWVYDLSDDSWTQQSPSTSPSARLDHAMASIGGDESLLFGGGDWDTFTSNETWVYDLSADTWTLRNPSTKPTVHHGHAMASIGGDQVLLLCGNDNEDTWVYDLSSDAWTLKYPATKPSYRIYHSMASIGGDQVLLFGGYDLVLSQGFLDDSWVYDLSDNTWSLHSQTIKPTARAQHKMASIGGNQVLLYGGAADGGLDKTWLYTAPVQSCNNPPLVSAGADEHMYFGYEPGQCKTKTAVVTGGTAPFAYVWSLNRSLLTDVVNASGDETMSGGSTATVTLCLLADAELCVTVTDATGCTATDCATMYAEDVRCFTDNSSNQKVSVCHNGNTLCVASSSLEAHLAHGDLAGTCSQSKSADAETGIPGEYALEQNYPNPFNPTTTITYAVPADAAVLLRVFDASGGMVAELENGWRTAGKHTVAFDARSLPSGTYGYRLEAGDRVLTGTMTLMK